MQILSGKELSQTMEEEMRAQTAALVALGIHPSLVVIRVGEDPASEVYVRSKVKLAEKLGMRSLECHLSAETTQDELEAKVREFNEDGSVHGMLCQLPLPGHLNESRITDLISPKKDVDCFHPENVGLMAMGTPRFLPCTPAGVMELLSRNGIETSGRHAVVLGRSNIVGRPMSILLSLKGVDATVTVCHSRTADIAAITSQADILISAIGSPRWVTANMVKEGAVVVDVGIHRIPDATKKSGFRLCGDVDFEQVSPKVSAITPVPGGVGVMTVTMLLKNTLKAATPEAT